MKNTTYYLLTASILILSSCTQPAKTHEDEEILPPVSITNITVGNIQSTKVFNGSTRYLKKNTVTSPISGYVIKVNHSYGDHVKKNDVLFELQTREGIALETNKPGNHSMGIIKILAPAEGIITELFYPDAGGFVAEGSTLCMTIDPQNLVIQADIPYSYSALVEKGTSVTIMLPGNNQFPGHILQSLPTVDQTNQTLSVLIAPQTKRLLPENLNLLVQFTHTNLQTKLLPKSAVMCNETQTHFWVMKIIDKDMASRSSTSTGFSSDSINMAVHVPVSIGISNDSLVEILSPTLQPTDMIISHGAYGLADSTQVSIIN